MKALTGLPWILTQRAETLHSRIIENRIAAANITKAMRRVAMGQF